MQNGSTDSGRTRRIALGNDRLRVNGVGGRIIATAGVTAQGDEFLQKALTALRGFDDFTPDNDPYGEHVFGSYTVAGTRLFWKIDYYDQSLCRHSPDPADPKVTQRVLPLMLPDEY